MPQAMTQHSPGSLDQWLYFLTQRTEPNLHQIHFFIFCVNKGFRFTLVYSCLHYLLFKNEKVFLFSFLRSSVSSVSTIKQDRESGVVSLRWTEIPDQNMIMNLNISAATIRSFKMLIDYTLDLTPPLPRIPPSKKKKKKRRRRNCFKIPTCTGPMIANTPSKFFRLHLGTNFPSFDWDLLAFQTYFCFHPPPPPPMLLLKSSHRPKLSASHASPRVKRASFWLA